MWCSLGSAVAEQATPQLYHSMVLQLKLRQVRHSERCDCSGNGSV